MERSIVLANAVLAIQETTNWAALAAVLASIAVCGLACVIVRLVSLAKYGSPHARVSLFHELKKDEMAGLLAFTASRLQTPLVITDPESRIEWVNESFTQVTGYALEEIRGRKPGSFLQGPATDPETSKFMREAVLRGEGFEVELVNYHKSGKPYWLAIEGSPVRDESGVLRHFIAIERDVTAEKRAKAIRRVLHEATIVMVESPTFDEAAPRIVQIIAEGLDFDLGESWIVDEERMALRPGPGACCWARSGVDPEFVERWMDREFLPDEGIPGRVWRQGAEWLSDLPNNPKFSRMELAREQALQSGMGVPITSEAGVVGVLCFYTRGSAIAEESMLPALETLTHQLGQFAQRTRAQTEKNRLRSYLAAVLDASHVSLIAVDDSKKITIFNSGAERMLGYTRDELVGKESPLIIHDKAEVQERGEELSKRFGIPITDPMMVFLEPARRGLVEAREWTYIRKDGTRLTVELSVNVMRGAGER